MKCILWGLLLAGLMIAGARADAQRENIWAFGRNAGLDFSNGSPVALQTTINSTESSASVCSAGGQLLFYTDGSYVWSSNHMLMPNGSDLTTLNIGSNVTSSTSQGTVIVPMPDSSSKYYIFSLTSFEWWGTNAGRLYYSVVDMNLNGGMGDVVPGKKAILLDSFLLEKLTVARGNNCSLWLIVSTVAPALFKAYAINGNGISSSPVVSAVGTGGAGRPAGVATVSPDGKKLAATHSEMFGTGFNSAVLYDFDPVSGLVTNPFVLLPNFSGSYGTCFSPDNTKVYVQDAINSLVYQFDLTAGSNAAILSSRTTIGPCRFSHLKLGPDGKIYMRSPDASLGGLGDNGLAAIRKPNLAGTACDFDPAAVALLPGTVMNLGLPNVVRELHRDTSVLAGTVTAGCFAVNVLLQPGNNAGWNYLWDNGATSSSRWADTPGVYRLRYYTAPCTIHLDTFHVRFPYGTLPQLSVRSSCKGDQNGKAWVTKPSWDTVMYVYTWSDAANTVLSGSDTLQQVSSGSYTLRITAPSGCDTTLSLYIPEEAYQVSFTADTLVCTGTAISFQNTSSGHFTQFHWNFGDGQQTVLEDPVHTYTAAGVYEVQFAGSGAICRDTAFKKIIVDAPLDHIAIGKDRDNICTGESIVFTPSDSTAVSLEWGFGSEQGLVRPNEIFQKAFDAPGIFAVSLTAHFRVCPDIAARDTVTVHALPLVDLGPDSAICLNGKAISLYNHAVNPQGNYHFDWSNGETATSILVKHQGRYSLALTNTFGCTTTESVTVNKDCYIDIPNAFTPNNDGVNDYFFPRQLLAAKLTKFRMTVYNRWGQIVFETERINGRGWDGKLNNVHQPEGVYVYLITAEIAGSIQEQYRGNVTLIR